MLLPLAVLRLWLTLYQHKFIICTLKLTSCLKGFHVGSQSALSFPQSGQYKTIEWIVFNLVWLDNATVPAFRVVAIDWVGCLHKQTCGRYELLTTGSAWVVLYWGYCKATWIDTDPFNNKTKSKTRLKKFDMIKLRIRREVLPCVIMVVETTLTLSWSNAVINTPARVAY